MVIFHSYVSLPEGTPLKNTIPHKNLPLFTVTEALPGTQSRAEEAPRNPGCPEEFPCIHWGPDKGVGRPWGIHGFIWVYMCFLWVLYGFFMGFIGVFMGFIILYGFCLMISYMV